MDDLTAEIPSDYKDRKTGLIVFGVILIALGCLSALFIPLMLLALLVTPSTPGAPHMTFQLMLPGLVLYGTLAVAFIWLGIGSATCRRWARALVLIGSSYWLFFGVETFITMTFIMPKALMFDRPGMPHVPDAIRTGILVFTMCINLVIFVIIPLALFLFYRSDHVKATCIARDPVTRWTDLRPLPILALCVLLLCSGGMGLFSLITAKSIVPFFGFYLTGIAATAIRLLTSAVYFYSCYACHRLRIIGWWLAIGCYTLTTIATLVTTITVGMGPILDSVAGLPSAQVEQTKELLQGSWMWWSMLGFNVPILIFMIYTKRFFKQQ